MDEANHAIETIENQSTIMNTISKSNSMKGFVLIKDDSALAKIRQGIYSNSEVRAKTQATNRRNRTKSNRKSIDFDNLSANLTSEKKFYVDFKVMTDPETIKKSYTWRLIRQQK